MNREEMERQREKLMEQIPEPFRGQAEGIFDELATSVVGGTAEDAVVFLREKVRKCLAGFDALDLKGKQR